MAKRRCSGSGPGIRTGDVASTQRRPLIIGRCGSRSSEALTLSVVTVIIDDLHLMEQARGSGPLRDALRRASPNRRLVIATRSDPILALHEARLAGKVREIRADDLAFDEDETRQFLAANDIAVSAEQAYALWVHTEGWPAGLRLSTTPLSRGSQTDEALTTLLQGDTAVGSYLMGQALAYTPDDLRAFLLQTSVSEFLDAELAEKLTGRADSALLLERARVQPGFLNRPSEGRWPYRYHPMFRALLLAELMGVASGEVRRLSALAAEWFASHGEHARAAPLAVQGQSWEVLAESILAGSCVALATGDRSWVRHALARLPASHLEANLSVQLASILLMVGTGARRQRSGGRGRDRRAGISGCDSAGDPGDHVRQSLVGRRARGHPDGGVPAGGGCRWRGDTWLGGSVARAPDHLAAGARSLSVRRWCR